MTAIVRRNCLRLILVSGLWIGVFSLNDAPVGAQPPESCGNEICEQSLGETPGNCPVDCREVYCGDAYCDEIEVGWCQQDCMWCGDGYCHPSETQYCYEDCEPVCGDGYCDWREEGNCPWDCPEFNCGDNICVQDEIGWCIEDCGYCGDSICESHEQTWCTYDCWV